MSSRTTNKGLMPSTNHFLRPRDVDEVICRRLCGDYEEYLVRWRPHHGKLTPARVICSWHPLGELSRAMHHVQKYLDTCKQKISAPISKYMALSIPNSRKRKSPESDGPLLRDSPLSTSGFLAPNEANATASTKAKTVSIEDVDDRPRVYNAVLERKDGWIVVKKQSRRSAAAINFADATMLPTQQMLDEALRTPVSQAERAIREAFYRKVRQIPRLSLENTVDSSTPSLDFTFIKDYVLGEGVYRADPDSFEGCQAPCKSNMGQHIGCEYPRLCTCLEYAAVNETVLAKEEPARYEEYLRQKSAGEYIDKSNLPKRFPYHRAKGDHMPQTLQTFYRDSRHPIYECNVNCNCGSVCKSRVVQKGRKVPLTIFKTPDRGWGVYCREDLMEGEFIDTYLGEIITNEEADNRESQAGTKDKASYLYSLDKFVGDSPDLTAESCYIVDGQYKGGPTRFINHSCEPNCRQYTVSYNKHDPRVYDLAFFAIENIAAGTELTFDYMDKDEEEEEDALRRREEAADDPSNGDKVPCNCGARKCRGFLWV